MSVHTHTLSYVHCRNLVLLCPNYKQEVLTLTKATFHDFDCLIMLPRVLQLLWQHVFAWQNEFIEILKSSAAAVVVSLASGRQTNQAQSPSRTSSFDIHSKPLAVMLYA